MSKKVEPDFSQEPGPALHSARWRFGAFELDETRRELRREGEILSLEPKPLNLLMLMLRHPGELVTKNELLDALWTGRVVNESVLGNCVTRVRQVLGDEGPLWLKTVHGFGYRFDAPVQLIEDENRAPTIAAPKLGFQPGDQPPMRPNWQLVRRLGRSGDSWLGEHVKTRVRRVFKFTSDPRGLSALKREVTVYRLLRESAGDKVCYVDLLDWNFDEAPWFVEAEYCPGGSLQEWFEAQGGISKVPLATRLDLIAQIAEALAEIHLVGVLHKDLKPANVFVVINADGQPSIRLADFGSSRLLDPDRLAALEITRMGFTQVLDANNVDTGSGTPLYLAPEVLAGHPATVKADVYALGVMLYQFAIGNLRRQMAAGWEAEVDDEILRDDIAAAAEGNPERRLADAGELARNLRRLEARRLAREAERVAAEKAERAARALERMKARRVGLMAAFAALAVGFVSSTTLYFQSVDARARAEKEAARANSVSRFLAENVFKPIDGSERPIRTLTVKELLDAASGQLQETFPDHPDVEADVRLSLGNAYAALEYPIEAGEQLERAIALYSQLQGEGARETLRASRKLIVNYYDRGKLHASLPMLEKVASAAEHELKSDDPDRIRFEIELARGQVLLGQLIPARDRLINLIVDIKRNRSESAEADAQLLLGWIHFKLGDVKSALIANQVAHEIYDRKLGKSHISTLNAERQRASILIDIEKFDEAESLLRSVEIAAQKWATDSSSVMLGIRQALAELNMRRGNPIEAIAILEQNLSNFSVGPGLIDESGQLRRKLASAYRIAGRLEDAEAMFKASVDTSAVNFGAAHPDTIWAKIELAELALSQGRLDPSESLCGASNCQNLIATEPSKLLKARLTMLAAMTLKARGKIAQSTMAAVSASKLFSEIYGAEHSMYKAAMQLASQAVSNADRDVAANLSRSTKIDEVSK